jgi:hypothetical protein
MMSDAADPKVVQLRKAMETPEKKLRAKPKEDKPKSGSGGDGPPPIDPRGKAPTTLPPDAPVKALGTLDGDYFYLDALGQLRRLAAEKHGRLHIISLFGGEAYLSLTWPTWKLEREEWVRKATFDHGRLADVLMTTCTRIGPWDPAHKVRGCGSWREDDGTLVMHCGHKLWISSRGHSIALDTGVRDDLLYPRRAPLAEPDFAGEPGPKLRDQLLTWNWARDETDAMLVAGWIMCAILGQAQHWRPAIWITGGKNRGKSTVQKLINWIFGDAGIIRPANATPAFIYQTIGDSCLPVSLDEFEAKADNAMQEKVIELMRIAASGGEVGRGGTENNPKTYNLRSCFLFGSINVQALSPQDRSRLAICELMPLTREGKDQFELEFDAEALEDDDVALGSRESWARVGRQLRGRLLTQWPRYTKTFRAYRHSLIAVGHDTRAAEQFGALGAGYDVAMFDAFDLVRAQEWAARLPAATLAETTGYEDNARGCLNHLLMATPDLVRHGTRETVSHYILKSREDFERGYFGNDPSDASRVLAKIGIRAYQAKELMLVDGNMRQPWMVAVSNSNPGLREIYAQTAWKGRPDAPGTWGQALRDLPMAGKPFQMRIDKIKQWVTPLWWDVVFEQSEPDAAERGQVAAKHLETDDQPRMKEME